MAENLDTQNEEAASMDHTIGAAWAEIQSRGDVERDDAGKFAAKEVEPVAEVQVGTEAQTDQTDQVESSDTNLVEEQQNVIKAPSSWRTEAKEKFAQLPPELQAEVIKREDDHMRGIKQYKDQAEKAQRYEQALAPYSRNFEAAGVSAEQAISGIMNTENILRNGSPAQKVAAVNQIIQQYGINPEWFSNAPQNIDPNVGYLQTKFQELEARQSQWQQQQERFAKEQQDSVLNSKIESFAQGKEHFETVKGTMAALIQEAYNNGTEISLDKAYDEATWANPTIRASIIAKQQADAKREAQAKADAAKKIAKVNVPRRGVLPTQAAVGSIDDTIRAAAKELGMF